MYSPDLPRLQIVPLVLRLAHGEGLAGQNAVRHHRAEQLILAHGRQQEAKVARLAAQLPGHVIPVDVVDLHLWAALAVIIQKGLKRSYCQLRRRSRNRPRAVQSLTADLHGVARPRAGMGCGIKGPERRPQILTVHMKQYPVDGFKGQRIDMLCTQLGWFGRLFGGKDILPLNISGSLILILLLFASGFTAYSIYSIKDCTNSKIEIQDIWSVVTPIITLALGYLFGSHKNNEV